MEMGLVELMGAGWLSKSIAVAARLGIADILDDGPLSHVEIAQAAQCHPEAMLRLLRLLASCEIFEITEDKRFRNSSLSERLRTKDRMSLRYFCILAGEEYYAGWGGLLHTVKTGKPAFPEIFGSSIYEYMERNSETAAVYDNAMQELARPVGFLLSKSYDFSSARRVVDIGGGAGMLLKQLLSAYKHLQGVCVDREDVCARAEKSLAQTNNPDLAARLRFAPGSFFDRLPADGDVYILKNVLHNWNRDSCVSILKTVASAMTDRHTAGDGTRSRLLVIEPLIEPDNASPRDLMDPLFQMVICEEGTRERSRADFEVMLADAGLKVTAVQMLPTGHGVLEAEARGQ